MGKNSFTAMRTNVATALTIIFNGEEFKMASESPQLKTYKVTSKTIPHIREELDFVERENGPTALTAITEYFTELYGGRISVEVCGNSVLVELTL